MTDTSVFLSVFDNVSSMIFPSEKTNFSDELIHLALQVSPLVKTRYVIFYIPIMMICKYSKTPIYRCVWGQGNIRGKSGSVVNRGFVWFTLCMFSPIWARGNGRGISGFAVNRGAVNRGFTV